MKRTGSFSLLIAVLPVVLGWRAPAFAGEDTRPARNPDKRIAEDWFANLVKQCDPAGKAKTQFAVAETPPGEPFDEIVFVKRFTYSANHYYTEYVNSKWMPGGNLCVLDIKSGKVKELVSELKGGVYGRFDISFDAKKIVFAWKAAKNEGYRIYEIHVDGSGLRQLTFPQSDEKNLHKLYSKTAHDPYHHGTDDMHPCYLPDGGIAFISTRCQYGTLCSYWGRRNVKYKDLPDFRPDCSFEEAISITPPKLDKGVGKSTTREENSGAE